MIEKSFLCLQPHRVCQESFLWNSKFKVLSWVFLTLDPFAQNILFRAIFGMNRCELLWQFAGCFDWQNVLAQEALRLLCFIAASHQQHKQKRVYRNRHSSFSLAFQLKINKSIIILIHLLFWNSIFVIFMLTGYKIFKKFMEQANKKQQIL